MKVGCGHNRFSLSSVITLGTGLARMPSGNWKKKKKKNCKLNVETCANNKYIIRATYTGTNMGKKKQKKKTIRILRMREFLPITGIKDF
jgi:hypothetical protein